MISICLVGLGKTGKEIAKAIMEQNDLKLVSVVCSPNSSKIGKDLGELIGCVETGIIIESSDHIEQVVFKSHPDVVVDFSNPIATMKNARIFARMKVNMVIGTTGFSEFDIRKLLVLTKKNHTGIVYAPNVTLGVNVLMLLSNLAANILNNYDFQITEIHHKHKKDSPSGTALKIAKEIEKGLVSSGLEISNENDIPINAIRAGGVVGKHEVMIVGEDDKIEISHESFSRRAFALGAIKGIRFVHGKSGYFEMNDVLDLKKVLGDYVDKEDTNNKKRHMYYGTKNII
ncbi:MAG: 4-hydroxy-tetrahydrodipicolinate reductase [Firmicutes bacterium HGW-Firmicutes-15]|nr:MAG: 4-hydroxy-tetrahydrodipicolinate reductase [Firmicutes bacterium HGW-Firmicutes-15]